MPPRVEVFITSGGRGYSYVVNGEALDHGRVMFYGTPRLRIERSFEDLTNNETDRAFLKVNRIAGSGL